MKNAKIAFILVAIITIILLAGSVVLQRIVFSAEESSSSVYISPANFIVKPNSQIKLTVISDFSIPAFVTAGQFVFKYDDTHLDFVESRVGSNLKTEKIVAQGDKIYWAVTPNPSIGIVGKFKGNLTIGQLIFDVKDTGSTRVSLIPNMTIISAIDPQGSNALYNTVTSVQESIGEITNNTDINTVGSDINEEIINQESSYSTQKITRNTVVALAEGALHIVELNKLGLVNILYGKTNDLRNLIKTSTVSTNQSLKINDLDPDTKYYYQIKVLSPDSKHIFSDPVKTFNTKKISSSQIVDRAELIVEDSTPSKKTNIFAVAFDQENNIISPTDLEFSVVDGDATISVVGESYPQQVLVTSLINKEQKVSVAVSLTGKKLSEININFNPENVDKSGVSTEVKTSFSASTQMTLATLLLVILLTGLALVRLLRVK